MYVRLTGRRTVSGRCSREGASIVFRPPVRDNKGKIQTDQVYFIADDAWSPAEKDALLGPMENEVPAVERDAKGKPIIKDGRPIAILDKDGKPRKEWVPADGKTPGARRNGGVFEEVPEAEVRNVELEAKKAKALVIAAKVKAGELPADALNDYKAYLPQGTAPKGVKA